MVGLANGHGRRASAIHVRTNAPQKRQSEGDPERALCDLIPVANGLYPKYQGYCSNSQSKLTAFDGMGYGIMRKLPVIHCQRSHSSIFSIQAGALSARAKSHTTNGEGVP